jgi:capsular polysaccharide biosynthesis protein
MVAKIGEDNYRQALPANNDYNNCICSIEILYMHSSHFDLSVTYNNAEGKIGECFNDSPFIIDVQPTNRSEETASTSSSSKNNTSVERVKKSHPLFESSKTTQKHMETTTLTSPA